MALIENVKVESSDVKHSGSALNTYLDTHVGQHSTTYKNADAAAFTKGLDDRAKSMRVLSDYYAGTAIPSNIQPALQAALLEGDQLYVPDGNHSLTTPVVVDHTIAGFPIMGRPSKRFDVIGASMPNTIFNTNGNDAFVYTGTDGSIATQAVHSGQRFENFTVYGVNNTGVGLRLTGAAYMGVRNLQFVRCSAGINMTGVLTSDFERISAQYCNYGMYINTGLNSTANAIRIQGIFSGNNKAGIEGEVGTGVYIGPSNFEGNGRYDGGDPSCRAVYLRVKEPMGVITLDTPYFEANSGEADIRIDNLTSSPIIVNIKNGVFIRGNSTGGFCTYNIRGVSTGGGPIFLNLDGCYFFTQTAFGYVPSSARPFISGFSRVSGIGSCWFSETISLGTGLSATSEVMTVNVNSAGTIVSGPSDIISTHPSTGVYTVECSGIISFGQSADTYAAVAVCSASGGQVGYVQRVSSTVVRVVMYNAGTSTVANQPFTLMISRSR